MFHHQIRWFGRWVTPVLVVGLLGCDALGITEDEEDEVRVTVRAIGASHLDASDNFRYEINDETEYEGVRGLSEIRVGQTVEIEFAPVSSTTRRALEIEVD